MTSLKNKIIFSWQKVKKAVPFLNWGERRESQEEIDKKLVYGLSPRKIPNSGQLKHFAKFLNPKEYLIVKICFLLIVINVVYLGTVFIKKHLNYSPVAGGEYTEGVVGYPKTINPLYAVNRDVDSDLSRLIYSSLFKYDQNGQLVNDLAESLTIDPSGLVYTVKIKKNAPWHNSGIVTADDVIFTFDLIKNSDYRSPLRSNFLSVEAEKIDDQTIKFVLAQSYAPFTELLTFGILPKSLWENVSPNSVALNDLNLKPIGSGPYKFKSLIKSTNGDLKEYHLVVNENYYGPKPYLKNINFKFFVDYPEMIKAFNDNQLDGLSYLPFADRQELLAPDSVSFHELSRAQIVAVFFNHNKDKALDDKNVRIGLAEALNRPKIIQDVFGGVYRLVDGPILENSFAYNPQLKKYDYSPVEAINFLKNKLASTTLTVIDSGNNVILADKIKSYWEQAGVAVELKIVSSDQAVDVVKNRDFETLIYGESIGGDPDVYAFWHSSQASSKGLNLAGYSNTEVDKLLTDARASTDRSERQAKYQKFQEILTADVPVIFLYSPSYTYIQSKKIKGFNGTTVIEPADRFASISDWYVKTSKKLTW